VEDVKKLFLIKTHFAHFLQCHHLPMLLSSLCLWFCVQFVISRRIFAIVTVVSTLLFITYW